MKIKNIQTLAEVARRMGVEVEEGENLQYNSNYAGTVNNAAMILRAGSGDCAIIQEADGTYRAMIDNYGNPITQVVGNDCSILCREYTEQIVRDQAMMMGGMISERKLLADGSVELHIALT